MIYSNRSKAAEGQLLQRKVDNTQPWPTLGYLADHFISRKKLLPPMDTKLFLNNIEKLSKYMQQPNTQASPATRPRRGFHDAQQIFMGGIGYLSRRNLGAPWPYRTPCKNGLKGTYIQLLLSMATTKFVGLRRQIVIIVTKSKTCIVIWPQ